MSKPTNRIQLMERVGATQLNNMWSWCAVNDDEKSVYLSIWTDSIHKDNGITRYVVQEPFWGINEAGNKSAARNDQDNKLSLIFDMGYEPYGYFIVPKDSNAHPREIAETRTSFVMKLALSRLEDGTILATPTKRIEIR